MVGGSWRRTKGRINLGDRLGVRRQVQVVHDRGPLAARSCPPLDALAPPLEETGDRAGGRPEVCARVVGASMEVKMPCVVCVWTREEGRGGSGPAREGQMAAAAF